MKNGSSTITLIEKDHSPTMMNQQKPCQKLSCLKKDHAVNLMGLQRCYVFSAASKQPNNQLRCFLPTTYEIGGNNQREKARIGKSQRNRLPSRQWEVSHIISNTYKTIGDWSGNDVASLIQLRPYTIRLSFISKFTKVLKW